MVSNNTRRNIENGGFFDKFSSLYSDALIHVIKSFTEGNKTELLCNRILDGYLIAFDPKAIKCALNKKFWFYFVLFSQTLFITERVDTQKDYYSLMKQLGKNPSYEKITQTPLQKDLSYVSSYTYGWMLEKIFTLYKEAMSFKTKNGCLLDYNFLWKVVNIFVLYGYRLFYDDTLANCNGQVIDYFKNYKEHYQKNCRILYEQDPSSTLIQFYYNKIVKTEDPLAKLSSAYGYTPVFFYPIFIIKVLNHFNTSNSVLFNKYVKNNKLDKDLFIEFVNVEGSTIFSDVYYSIKVDIIYQSAFSFSNEDFNEFHKLSSLFKEFEKRVKQKDLLDSIITDEFINALSYGIINNLHNSTKKVIKKEVFNLSFLTRGDDFKYDFVSFTLLKPFVKIINVLDIYMTRDHTLSKKVKVWERSNKKVFPFFVNFNDALYLEKDKIDYLRSTEKVVKRRTLYPDIEHMFTQSGLRGDFKEKYANKEFTFTQKGTHNFKKFVNRAVFAILLREHQILFEYQKSGEELEKVFNIATAENEYTDHCAKDILYTHILGVNKEIIGGKYYPTIKKRFTGFL